MGEHASNPQDLDASQPGREGIGNVARLLGGDHPSDIPSAQQDQQTLCVNRSTLSLFFTINYFFDQEVPNGV